jgi:glucose-6-phosphate 1-dehydrogenase
MIQTPMAPAIVVIFGASGDLTKRKLIPALYNLFLDKQLPPQFSIIAMSRQGETVEFCKKMKEAVAKYSRRGKPEDAKWDEFCSRLEYIAGEYSDPAVYKRLAKKVASEEKDDLGEPCNRIFYLSIPPSIFGTVASNLGAVGLSADRKRDRIVVEKPFGRDQESSEALNKTLLASFEESQIYRIDHYLGKETVQNIMAFRFANTLFEPIWNRRYVDHVQITVSEEVGVEKRGGYYESSGALRDMIQNHLLQLMCVVATEPPVNFEANEVRNKKVDVLRAVRPIPKDRVSHYCVRGQYGPGLICNKIEPGYRQEEGVEPQSDIETYAAVKLYIDNWRWEDVPFYLRTGKRLPRKLSQIVVQFRPVPHRMFPNAAADVFEPNRLIIDIQPEEGITLKFEAKEPGSGMRLRNVSMHFNYSDAFHAQNREAYETLLQEVMMGDQTLFMRNDQEHEAWRLVMPILEAWESVQATSFPNYAGGTWGPEQSDSLLARDGRSWFNPAAPLQVQK